MELPVIIDQPTATPGRRKRERGRHGLGHVYEHRANWWLDVRLQGYRRRVKLGPTKVLEKREARQIADEKIKELLMPKHPESLPAMAFSAFAKKFVAWAVETKLGWEQFSGKELDQTPLKHAVKFFGDTPVNDISKDRVKDFALHIGRRRIASRLVKNRTINGYLKDLRHMFNKAIEWGDATSNPVAKFKFADEQRQKSAGRILESDEEQNKLLGALPAWLRLMAAIGLQTGARRGDLVKLTWKSVHPDYLEFLETKECRHREVPLSHSARTILAMLRPFSADPDAFVFEPDTPRKTVVSRIRREWARAIERSGVARIRFHDIRHTVGTRLVRGAVDLRTVQGILGHASLKTTERYLHSSDKLKQAAVEKLSEYGRRSISASESPATENAVNDNIN